MINRKRVWCCIGCGRDTENDCRICEDCGGDIDDDEAIDREDFIEGDEDEDE